MQCGDEREVTNLVEMRARASRQINPAEAPRSKEIVPSCFPRQQPHSFKDLSNTVNRSSTIDQLMCKCNTTNNYLHWYCRGTCGMHYVQALLQIQRKTDNVLGSLRLFFLHIGSTSCSVQSAARENERSVERKGEL